VRKKFPLLKKLKHGCESWSERFEREKKKSDGNKFMSKDSTSNKVEGNDGMKMFGNDMMSRANEGGIKFVS